MPAYRYDFTGEKHGMLTAIKDVGSRNGKRLWLCNCDCGKQTSIPSARFGVTLSCGCIQRSATGLQNRLRSRENISQTTIYKSYRSMLTRCLSPTAPNYSIYGGRGIRVCDRWLGPDGFANFCRDMGERPPGMSLDRKDVNGDYTPENCQWADAKAQAMNRRATPASIAMREANLAKGRKYWPRKEKT